MSQDSVIIIKSSQDGDTSNEMGTKSDRSTNQTPPDPPTPLGAFDHLNRQESSLPAQPQQQQQSPPPPIVMAAPFLRVPNPDLVMFNIANTVTASATIADAQPVLIEVDLDHNIHHVLNFRNNYDIDTIIRAWSQNRRRVIIEENDEGIQTFATSVQDSQPSASASIEEFRLITDFSRLNANPSSTNATAGSSQPSHNTSDNTPPAYTAQNVTFAEAVSSREDTIPTLIQDKEEEEREDGEDRPSKQ